MSKPFELNKSYRTKEGDYVTVLVCDNTPGYEYVLGDDNICRYNRDQDRGRVTGSGFDMTYRRNLIPDE
jgi:hypothetical protein